MTELAAQFTKRHPRGAVIHADLHQPAAGFSVTVLFGPSGCGKTTILRCLAGLEKPEDGVIRFGDEVWLDTDRRIFRTPQERGIGFLFQDYALFPHLRVAENIAFGLRHLAPRQRDAQVGSMLEMIGLSGLERRYPHELSGGQQQRVALARALAQKPVVLLLDEPFSNLDPDMTGKMREDLHRLLRRTNTTTVLVTHDHEEAFAMADRIAVLNNGRLEQFDTPEAIYHTPSTPFVADFVGQADFIPGIVRDGKVLTEIGEFPNQVGYQGGAHVVVMIRPDDVHVVPSEHCPARIVARQFRGSENLYMVGLPSGAIVHSSEPSTSVHPIGTPVELQVIATHTVLFEQGHHRLPDA